MSLRLCSRAPWTTSSSAAIRRQSSGRTGVRIGGLAPSRRKRRQLFDGRDAPASPSSRPSSRSPWSPALRALAAEGARRAAPPRGRSSPRRCGPASSGCTAPRSRARSASRSTTSGSSAAIGLLLWLVVPRALDQIEQGARRRSRRRPRTSPPRPSTRTGSSTRSCSASSTGSSASRSGAGLIHPAVTYGRTALEVFVGDLLHLRGRRLLDLREGAGAGALRQPRQARGTRKRIVDTWDLIDAKLGAFVRGQLLMITFVSTVLSLAFWADRPAVLAADRRLRRASSRSCP